MTLDPARWPGLFLARGGHQHDRGPGGRHGGRCGEFRFSLGFLPL